MSPGGQNRVSLDTAITVDPGDNRLMRTSYGFIGCANPLSIRGAP
jgi:hypothetical protein